MNINRREQIAERRAQMPRSYRATYDKAVSGRSLRASINSFCQECVCFQIDEIRNCTELYRFGLSVICSETLPAFAE